MLAHLAILLLLLLLLLLVQSTLKWDMQREELKTRRLELGL